MINRNWQAFINLQEHDNDEHVKIKFLMVNYYFTTQFELFL